MELDVLKIEVKAKVLGCAPRPSAFYKYSDLLMICAGPSYPTQDSQT